MTVVADFRQMQELINRLRALSENWASFEIIDLSVHCGCGQHVQNVNWPDVEYFLREHISKHHRPKVDFLLRVRAEVMPASYRYPHPEYVQPEESQPFPNEKDAIVKVNGLTPRQIRAKRRELESKFGLPFELRAKGCFITNRKYVVELPDVSAIGYESFPNTYLMLEVDDYNRYRVNPAIPPRGELYLTVCKSEGETDAIHSEE